MTTAEIVTTIEASGGSLWRDGDRLRYRLPESALPLVEELRAKKPDILALLQEREMPDHDPAAWAEDFHRWAMTRCRFKDRCFGETGALLSDFGEWATQHDSVPMRRETFEALLRDQGFFFADGLVYGLILAEDLKPGCVLHPDVLLGDGSGFGAGIVDSRRGRKP